MGWTAYPANFFKKNGSVDRKAECDSYSGLTDRYNVLKSAMVGKVYYAAVKDGVTESVFAVVFLTQVDNGEFFYKDMDETMQPCYYKCPKGILKLLTPTDNEYANTWRKTCHEYHEEKKSPKLFKNLPEGARVMWTVASDGWSHGIEKGDKIKLQKIKKPHSNRYVWMLDNGFIINPKYIGQDEYELIG